MDFQRPRFMEKLALQSSLNLEGICDKLRIAFQLPAFVYGSENENAWGFVRVDHVEVNVSKPYDPESLESWDPAVPYGFNVGICLIIYKEATPDKTIEWSRTELVPRWAQTAANVLQTTVIHHRTWQGGSRDVLPNTKYLPR